MNYLSINQLHSFSISIFISNLRQLKISLNSSQRCKKYSSSIYFPNFFDFSEKWNEWIGYPINKNRNSGPQACGRVASINSKYRRKWHVCAIISLSLVADSDGVDCDNKSKEKLCTWKRGQKGERERAQERKGRKREKKERKRGHVTRHNTNETDGAGPWEALTAGQVPIEPNLTTRYPHLRSRPFRPHFNAGPTTRRRSSTSYPVARIRASIPRRRRAIRSPDGVDSVASTPSGGSCRILGRFEPLTKWPTDLIDSYQPSPLLSSCLFLPFHSSLSFSTDFSTSTAVTATVIAAGRSFGLPRDRVPRFDASLNDIRSNGDRDTMRVSGIFFVRGYFSSRLLIWCATFSFSFTIQSRFFHDSSRRPVVTVRFFSLVYSIHFLFRTFAFYTLFFFSFRFCKFRFDVYLSSILQ